MTAVTAIAKPVPTKNSDSSEKSGVLRITAIMSAACLSPSSDPSFTRLANTPGGRCSKGTVAVLDRENRA
jgi:hypothetical protein